MRQILFQIGKNFYGGFSDVATGLWRRLFEPYAMSRVVLYQRFKLGRMSIKDDPKSGWPSTSMDGDRVDKVLAAIRKNIPLGETVNKEFYLNVMKRLRAAVRRKRPEAWTNNTWILHHDNAPAHASLLKCEFLMKHETTVVPQPPYSPDVAPEDFFLFPKLKSSLKGHRFQTAEEIEENSTRDLRAIPQNTFQDAFQNWKKHWERCIKSGGEYFEGDKVVSKTNLKKIKFCFFMDCPHMSITWQVIFQATNVCEVPEMTMTSASNIHSQTANKVKNA